MAENNWWGELPPDESEFLGPVDIAPYDSLGSNALVPDLVASVDQDSQDVRLEWHDRASACGYRILRGTMPDGGFTDVSGLVMESVWEDLGTASSPSRYFWFVAID